MAELAAAYRWHLNVDTSTSLAELCFTAGAGRSHFRHRLAVVARSRDQLCDKLRLLKSWEEREGLRGSLVFSGYLGNQASQAALLEEALAPRLQRLAPGGLARLARWCSGEAISARLAALFAQRQAPPAEALSVAELSAAPLSADEWLELTAALGLFYVLGTEIDWERVQAGQPVRRVWLPTYPFQRHSYWVAGSAPAAAAVPAATGLAVTVPAEEPVDLSDCFYRPVWREAAAPAPREVARGTWLLLAERGAAQPRRRSAPRRSAPRTVGPEPGTSVPG